MKFLFRYTLALLLTARSLAGELTEPESDHTYTTTIDGRQLSSFGQRIIFEEPMADVHRQGRNCILSSEQANKMYRITGDGPTPLLQWESASEALIYYRQGTAPNTRYRLSFHEGSRQYLSGRTMKTPEIEFCAPPCRLTITDESNRVLIEGSEREGVLLEVNEDLYKTIEIPPQSLEFTFLRKESGETIRGIAEPARIKDLRPLALREAYKDAPRDILAALTPETVVPGYLLVKPECAIDGPWVLQGGAENSAYRLFYRNGWEQTLTFAGELKAELRAALAHYQGKEQVCLGLLFNAPLAEQTVPELFHALELRCGDALAENAEGSLSKKVLLNGREITFTLHEASPYSAPTPQQRISFPAPWTDRIIIRVDGAQELLPEVTVTIPADTRALRGLRMLKPQVCSTRIPPAEPSLPFTENRLSNSPIRVPYVGEHRLGVPCLGCESVQARLAYLPRDKYALWKSILHKPVNSRKWAERTAAVNKLLGNAKEYTTNARQLHPHTFTIDLDDLADSPLRPGMYVLHLQGNHQAPPDDNRYPPYEDEAYLCLQVTDLDVIVTDDSVIAYHLSDGRPVDSADVCVFSQEGHVSLSADDSLWRPLLQGTLKNGVFPYTLKKQRLSFIVRVSCGDDVAEADLHQLGWKSEPRQDETTCIHLKTDRASYRPGETVHLFGTLRTLDEHGILQLTGIKEVRLKTDIADSEQVLQVNEHGVFHTDILIPADNNEFYEGIEATITAENGATAATFIVVDWQERRSFEVDARLEMRQVSPEEGSFVLEAKDFSGAPVRGEAEIYLQPSWTRQAGETVKIALDDAGKAVYNFSLSAFEPMPPMANQRLMVTARVTNEKNESVDDIYAHQFIHAAAVSLQYRDGRLSCLDSATMQPSAQEQEVTVDVEADVSHTETLPNGILLTESRRQRIHQQRIIIPPHAQEGVDVSCAAIAAALQKQCTEQLLPDCDFLFTFSATDAAGRVTQLKHWEYVHTFRQDKVNMQVEVKDGRLSVPLRHPHADRYLVVLRHEQNCRLLYHLPAEKDLALSIDLLPQELARKLNVLVVPLKRDDQSVYRPLRFECASIATPANEKKLSVLLQRSEQSVRPGGTLNLEGRVTYADGTPAAHAQVILYAVDKGRERSYESTWNFSLRKKPYYLFLDGDATNITLSSWCSMQDLPLRQCLLGSLESFLHDLRTLEREGDCGNGRLFWEYGVITLLQPQHLWPDSDAGFSGTGDLPPGKNRHFLPDLGDGFGGDALGAADEYGEMYGDGAAYLRTNFTPTPIWLPEVYTEADGHFCVEASVADTLTTYSLYAVAISADGHGSGYTMGTITANQPLMLSVAAPHCMRVGDTLHIPLTLTNNSSTGGIWRIAMPGNATPQQVSLRKGESALLYSCVEATNEGVHTLRWQAEGDRGSDAMECCVDVNLASPPLREIHDVFLPAGGATIRTAELLRAKRDGATPQLILSANPLQCLSRYAQKIQPEHRGSTEQKVSALMPWLLYEQLAPISPAMRRESAAGAALHVQMLIDDLLQSRCTNGGLKNYLSDDTASLYVSAYAGMVLAVAQEKGFSLPKEPWLALHAYLEQARNNSLPKEMDPATQYAIGRAIGDTALQQAALCRVVATKRFSRTTYHWGLHRLAADEALRRLHTLAESEPCPHATMQRWMRELSHFCREHSATDTAWSLMALHEYLKRLPQHEETAEVQLADGRTVRLGQEPVELSSDTLLCTQGCAFATILHHSAANTLCSAPVTDNGLHVTRRYEKLMPDGSWQPTTEFCVGDDVRITIQCVALHPGVQYLELTDYLPSCMKTEDEHYEKQGHCLRRQMEIPGSDVVTVQYHARVMFSGTSTAPAAYAAFMHAPQIYGSSASQDITTKR